MLKADAHVGRSSTLITSVFSSQICNRRFPFRESEKGQEERKEKGALFVVVLLSFVTVAGHCTYCKLYGFSWKYQETKMKDGSVYPYTWQAVMWRCWHTRDCVLPDGSSLPDLSLTTVTSLRLCGPYWPVEQAPGFMTGLKAAMGRALAQSWSPLLMSSFDSAKSLQYFYCLILVECALLVCWPKFTRAFSEALSCFYLGHSKSQLSLLASSVSWTADWVTDWLIDWLILKEC